MKHKDHIPFPDYAGKLRRDTRGILPGLQAQLNMAPLLRQDEIKGMGAGSKAVKSSVLILLSPDDHENTMTALIQRPAYEGIHSGQISFPGGRFEPQDADLQQTALREAKEEIGIDPAKVEVVKRLTDLYIPPSNHRVSPFVGLSSEKPQFEPDRKEVAYILELPIAQFLRKENVKMVPITLSNGQCLKTPCYLVNGQTIWGATAMIMAEFVEVSGRISSH